MSEKLSREEEISYGDITIEQINSERTKRHLNQITGEQQKTKTKKTYKSKK